MMAPQPFMGAPPAGPKPFHAGILVVKAPNGALVISGVDPKSSMWAERDIKVGDVLLAVDGKEPSNLFDALTMLKGPEGSPVSLTTDGGAVQVARDSNCSLGSASQGPTPGGPAPSGAMPMPMGGGAPPMQFNAIPGQAMTPQECAALGLPPGAKWGGGPKAEAPVYNGFGGGSVSESFLSI